VHTRPRTIEYILETIGTIGTNIIISEDMNADLVLLIRNKNNGIMIIEAPIKHIICQEALYSCVKQKAIKWRSLFF
jgi:hypothetical protein